MVLLKFLEKSVKKLKKRKFRAPTKIEGPHFLVALGSCNKNFKVEYNLSSSV
jgi:hypothetical protein